MSDDIVTRLRENCGCSGGEEFGYNCTNCDAADEIERLRTLLDNALERENKDNARQLQIVRKVEADRDMWKRTCTKLVGMMLPFSLLMNKTEQEELQIILAEAVKR